MHVTAGLSGETQAIADWWTFKSLEELRVAKTDNQNHETRVRSNDRERPDRLKNS